ncbi:MAG: hypothetical protein PHT94_02040 [Candidatus Nanoarchaeia archaeon]|nr:hypothetical protein [Candidatus Nanoarchaeia archaeon]
MAFEIREIKNEELNKKLDSFYEKSMKELISFFEINWNRNKPNVYLIKDRKMINKLRGEITENWIVGWSNSDVFLLNPENFEQESNHKYSDEKYFKLLKHELTHSFCYILNSNFKKPLWLIEGIAIYCSKQYEDKKKPEQYLGFIDSFENLNNYTYSESGFAVKYLIDIYGKEKIFELIKKSNNNITKNKFSHLFYSIYGFELKHENFKIL